MGGATKTRSKGRFPHQIVPTQRCTPHSIQLEKGPIEFEKLFTTPAHIQKLRAYGKLLGPKGLMPNAKIGTLVPYADLPSALVQAKAGQVSYRVDDGRNIHAQIGKINFTDEQLLRNWHAVMKSLVDRRPPTLKGKYFTDAYLKSTMGPGWKVNLVDIDPRTDKSIWGILEE
jgi:large subunit ribosomal protein L1